MKQIAAFVLVGGLVFVMAATFSGALYWLAPIVPCYVTDRSPYAGYGMREDFCTGEQVTSYQYGSIDYDERHEARLLHAGLFVGSLGAGALAGLLALAAVQRLSRPRPRAT